MSPDFIIFECINSKCLFRYPVKSSAKYPQFCPKCKSKVKIALEYCEYHSDSATFPQSNKTYFSILLDNLRSAYNVGSILRSADGFHINHIYLCGMTATPDNSKISKTSLGAENSVAWSYSSNSLITAQKLKQDDFYLYGLETGPNSHPIYEINEPKKTQNKVLIVGNELAGIDPMVRNLCDDLIYIPMMGMKSSYNVSIAFGIAAFYLCNKNEFDLNSLNIE